MTKNVELHLHKWSKMKGALGSVTETGSGGGFSGGSYSSWGGPAMSSYSGIGGSGSQGFANRIKSLVEITEKAKRAINELDVDGAIGNLHFHDDHVTAISLQSKLTALETYAGKVQEYLKDKIDQPFYEKLDKVGDRLEALNISDYKTSNQIGFKKTEVIYSDAGQYMGTQEVLAKEVGLKELYQVDNPYKKRLQAMYDSYKSSDDYKESKLSEEDYLFASHQTRAFTYHSLNDEKAAFEGKRDLLLAAGVVILSIFCPPAGAVAGVALAAADMYSAASGKDWMTGRELDDGERLMRGAFALFDLIPGVGYLNDLAKTGKVAGFAGIKASLKTSFKEGMEQAAKNVDNFKVLLKNVDDFGKRVVTKIDDFGKQLDNLVTNKVSSLADNVAGKLRHADETLSTAAQNFRLNIGLEPQLIDGFMPTPPPGKLSGLADNIQAFAKSLDGSVDDVARGASRQASKVSDNFADDVADVIVRKGEDVPRLKEVEVEFNRNPKHDKAEFTRQLADQEAGMNQLTVQEYLDNRERYIAEGRALEGNAAQQAVRKEAFEDKLEELINANMPIDKAEQEAQKWLDTQAALHNPDQIAGGYADRIGGMGDSGINSSIGAQWQYRIDAVDEQILEMASKLSPEQLNSTYLNVKLTH